MISLNILLGETSLYYFLSTLAQVLAAAMAIIAVFIQFRINSLSRFLVGDGKSLLKRWGTYRRTLGISSTHKSRLRDSIDRESLDGINEVVDKLAKKARENGETLEKKPNGLLFAQKRFKQTRSDLEDLISKSKKAFKFSLITAAVSTISILFVNALSITKVATLVLIGINLILFIWCTVLLWKGLQKGLRDPAKRYNDD